MSEFPSSNQPGEYVGAPQPYLPPDYGGLNTAPRPRMSKMAIWGFVLSCVSVFILPFLCLGGLIFSVRGLREARSGGARGYGLAVAGIVVGIISAILYVLSRFLTLH
ncbi:hypothetical protein AL755_12050 [Arthrobacter sp. ERGS1:01]|uniref:DUF4190 domain-containing protein n=1 Tax=Arthrobacter sp. ERGS1:01 TaxID=1704044 RepID=UPI0006B678FC|nr:DUF4190 domain-containing protein [Arthrobacter sp. ERGS1:01]ALE06032.1 hypothetical protein AL755_12050 [Arthrobacter sp. ERGS1:01]